MGLNQNNVPIINEILNKVTAYCEKKWLVIQRRHNGFETSFNRTWREYSTGFGSLRGDFWIGLETISKLTKQRTYELLIELTDWSDQFFIAKYDQFQISDEDDFYRLSISGSYKGNASKGKFLKILLYLTITIKKIIFSLQFNKDFLEDSYFGILN